MSWVEICLIVCAVLVPVDALFMVLPKIKGKKAKTEQPKQEKVAEKVEPKPKEQTKEEKPKEGKINQPIFESSQYSADDFKDYLKERNKNIETPKLKQQPKDFKDMSLGLDEYMKLKQMPKQDILDEINKMSPEMQAIVFAGLLDKKF